MTCKTSATISALDPASANGLIEQFILSLAHKSLRGNLADTTSSCKAPAAVAPKRRYGAPRRRKDTRSPRRFTLLRNVKVPNRFWTAPALRRFSQRHIKLCQCLLELLYEIVEIPERGCPSFESIHRGFRPTRLTPNDCCRVLPETHSASLAMGPRRPRCSCPGAAAAAAKSPFAADERQTAAGTKAPRRPGP